MPKKIILLAIPAIIFIFILSCDFGKNVAPVNPDISNLRLELNHNYADSVNLSLSASDPQGPEDVDSVWTTYEYLQGPASYKVLLHDDGLHGDSIASDGRYSATFMDTLGQFNLGYYLIHFYARDKANNLSHRLDSVFWAVDGNLPVLCDVIGPDSLSKDNSEVGYISVVAYDPDGSSDIDSVYVVVTKPNGSEGMHLRLNDDGTLGDSRANDGVFTTGIQPNPQSTVGEYIFTIYAIDNENNPSNNPTHIIIIY
jgi:hypothetical protein